MTAIPEPVEGDVPDGAVLPSDEALTMEAEAEQPTEEIVVVDEDTMTLINTQTGEVVGMAETPPDGLDDVKLAEYIGEKRAWHKGRVAGLEAEKQAWIDTINARFDTRIKRHKDSLKWYEATYHDFLFKLAKKLIGDGKKRSAAVGLLLLKLTKTRSSMEILDQPKAIGWLREAGLAEAVKVTETILVSQLPEALKVKLTSAKNQGKTGLAFHPGGEDQLKIE